MLHGLAVLVAIVGTLFQSPEPIHYRVTLKSDRHIDSTQNGDAGRGGTYNAVAFVTATITGTGAARMGHVVVDSVKCTGTGILSMAFDSSVGPRSRGTKYDFAIGSHSEAIPTPSQSNILTNTLGQVALMLFPTVGLGAQVGTAWTDSLDTSPMSDPTDKQHPLLTRWSVIAAGADTLAVDGAVRGALSSSGGQTVSSGVVTGTRHIVVAAGRLRWQASETKQETMMAGSGARSITLGFGTTTLEIVAIH